MAVEQSVSSLARNGTQPAGRSSQVKGISGVARNGVAALRPWHLYDASERRRGQARSLPSTTRHFPPLREPTHTTLHRPLFAGQCPEDVYPTRSPNPALDTPGAAHTTPSSIHIHGSRAQHTRLIPMTT
jgi:hypothetical protein